MTSGQARPRHLRPFGYTTKSDERKALILDVLRKSLDPMTRAEITKALDWPDSILASNANKSVDPLMLLMAEGRVGRISERPNCRYYADPDIAQMLQRKD